MIRKTTTVANAWRALSALALIAASWLLPASQSAQAFDVPLTDVAKLVSGGGNTCALRYDGTVLCWGSNYGGQLARDPDDLESSTLPLTINGLGAPAIDLFADSAVTCAKLENDSVKCWGNAQSYYPSHLANTHSPQNVPALGANLSDLMMNITPDGSDLNECVILLVGTAYELHCWRTFEISGLPPVSRLIPIEIAPGLSPIKLSSGWRHGCALSGLKNAYCWGSNQYGQLGNGSLLGREDIEDASVVLTLENIVQDIAAANDHTCAVLTDGGVRCWGRNAYGALGDGTESDRTLPVSVAMPAARKVVAGDFFACALSTVGEVYCWGSNRDGQLGDGTTGYRLAPAIVPGLSGVIMLSSTANRVCALLADTSVQCWGDGTVRPAPVILATYNFEISGSADSSDPGRFGDVLPDTSQVPEEALELGDAPDGGVPAYPGVPGHFPTQLGNAVKGPRHANPTLFKLGEANSIDAPVDADGIPNIDTSAQIANLDQGDDGWLNAHDITRLDDCQKLTLRVRVQRSNSAPTDAPLYLNAWLDGNRDGDWQDTRDCQGGSGHEWIVQNHAVKFGSSASIGSIVIDVPTQRILSSAPTAPAWLRLTLSDRPAITPPNASDALPDGRGLPSGYFGFGETEDYLWDPITPKEKYGEWDVRKSVGASGPVTVGSTLNYTIEVRRSGGSQANVAAALVDVLPPQTSFVSGVTVQQLAPTVSPASAVFEASRGGPNGRVRWTGTLTAGAHFRLRYSVRVDACTAAPVNNTAYVIVPGSGRVISSTTSTALSCTPPPPPSFTLSKQIVDAIGSTGFSGGAQLSETVYLLTLGHSGLSQNLAAVIQDGLPLGLTSVQVQASRGTISTTNAGRTVNWAGVLGSTLTPPQIWIRARVTGAHQCGRETSNTAQFAVRNPDGTLTLGATNAVAFTPGCTPPVMDNERPPVDGMTATPTPTTAATATTTTAATITPTPRPTNTSMPRPTNTSVPRPTNTPEPVETYTPVPRPTNTSVPAATYTPVPLGPDTPPGAPTNTPVPRPTNTPVPVETYTPVPRPTNTSVPAVTYTPVPAETYTPVPLPEVAPPGSVRVLLPLVSR